MSTPALRVLLVDDHTMFRQGLRDLLRLRGLDVVGEGSDGAAGVRLAAELRPDVVVMDLSMPIMGGAEATRRIVGHRPGTPVVIITISTAEPDVLEALLAGAAGYLLKDAPVDDVVAAILAAVRGDAMIAPAVAGRLVSRVRRDEAERSTPSVLAGALTDREREVLALLAHGADNVGIALELHVSTATVKRHVSAILEKLQVDNRVQAAVHAARHGLL